MDEAKRIQINVDVRSYNVPRLQLNINNTIFPLLWLNEVPNLCFNSYILKIIDIISIFFSRCDRIRVPS